ncbi:RNA-directed DNA polymerase (reverse transcriptase)-related family protein [Rhynchospora pubera]|uniref:RNA-directed DNA polymerase (Reverse transcriptase)-related family protein n=1 Tax=Rhynchospora pubera TaxID=906938 RepID=A0AAV8DAZ0_9POAL|nr:RNA-directed DNA polymerase (reverse transcriptase)-related family protein [Rhynchospora pubera]
MHISIRGSHNHGLRITININGRGEGFLSSTRGLRQECPMSSYVFIISMEILSRMLKSAMDKSMIQGVKVACTSPQVTHAIYADDLVLMGDTDESEVLVFTTLLQQFAMASGLRINPQKSGLWFSRICDRLEITRVKTVWNAKQVEGEEMYLGMMISQAGDLKRNGRMVLDRIRNKLAGWKSHMLSQAGRLVMIKAVLMALPVYAVSLEMFPKRVIREINSLLAKFLWGKTNQDRYLSFIAWHKVCKPLELGGLGIKDLQFFGEALFQNVVWSLMADENKLWIKICKSKYFPVVGFWRARNRTGCGKMWRQVLKLRDRFVDQVQRRLGDGGTCNALSQPWFENCSIQEEARPLNRKLKVCSLLQGDSGGWNMHAGADHIIPTKPGADNIESKYSVKEGYKEIISAHNGSHITHGIDWLMIWKWKKVAPKIKVFMWRLMHKELPLANNMHSRIHHLSSTCQRCHEENEYELHCMFFCHTSRQVWFASPLGIRVHFLPMDITVTLQQVMESLEEEGIVLFANTMWEIWKERNKTVIEHGTFKPQEVLQRARILTGANRTNAMQRGNLNWQHERYNYNSNAWQVLVDASWASTHKAGGAYVVFEKGCMHSIGMHYFQVQDAFHAEAIAMQEAIRYMFDNMNMPSNIRIEFFSDCLNLVTAVNQEDLTDLPSWKATGTVQDIILRMQRRDGTVTLRYAQREALKQPHELANQARRNETQY